MKNKVQRNKRGGWKNRIIGEGVEHPEQLLANPKNWRIHPREQQAALTGMLEEVGWVQRVIVNKRTGFVVDGHMRVEVAITKGETEVPVLYVDLTEEEEAKVLATFDPISGMAAMDAEKFKELVGEIEFASKDAEKAIASAADVAGVEMCETVTDADAEPQIDRAAELNKKWKVKAGDLWRIGEHRLLCGDSTKREDVQRVMGGEKAAICFTSPPYNLGRNVGLSTRGRRDNAYNGGCDDNKTGAEWLDLVESVLSAIRPFTTHQFFNMQMLAGNKVAFLSLLGSQSRFISDVAVWTKSNPQPAMADGVMDSAFEFVVVFSTEEMPTRRLPGDFRGKMKNVFAGTVNSENEIPESHSATFPIGLPLHFLAHLSMSSIADPFLGSGTTMVACENLGRKCRGIEISPDYCAVILERMQTAFPKLKIERVKK